MQTHFHDKSPVQLWKEKIKQRWSESILCTFYTVINLSLDNRLSFDLHFASIHSHFQQRLHVIHKLRITFCCPSSSVIIQKQDPTCSVVLRWVKPLSVTCIASKIIGLCTPTLSDMDKKATTWLAAPLSHESDLPLHHFIKLTPSGQRAEPCHVKRSVSAVALSAQRLGHKHTGTHDVFVL